MADSSLPVQVQVTPDPPTLPKPGYKTTEWWGHLAAMALTMVFASGLLTNSTALNIAGIAAAWLTNLGYTVSRTLVKTAAVLLLVGALGTTQTACGASQRAETLQTAQIAINSTAAGLLAYDRPHQDELAARGTPDQAAAALKAYRAKRAVFDTALSAAVDALIVAIKINDQPSLDGLSAAIVEVIADYQALKGTPKP